MAEIGNLGKLITFQVSSKRVLTFSNFQQSVKGRWTQHNRIQKKAVSEFLGADLRSASLTIKLNSMLGVKPRTILKRIEKAIEKGTAFTFVLGGNKIGKNQWVITDASESWDTVLSGGELVSCTLSLSLTEYIGG